MSDNRELAEKLMDANDMKYELRRAKGSEEEEMSRQEEQDEMDMILNEVNSEFQGQLEQLQSDKEDLKNQIEDLKKELKNWKSIADKDRIELEHWKEQHAKLKKIIKTIEDRYSPKWEKQNN